MRNRALHDALLAFAEQAAWQLAADVADGAEVPFELVEERGRTGASLYCYRPLTEEFIRTRIGVLGRLPSYQPAAAAPPARGGGAPPRGGGGALPAAGGRAAGPRRPRRARRRRHALLPGRH